MRHADLSVLDSLAAWWRRERCVAGMFPSLWKLSRLGWELVRDSTPERRRRKYGDAEYDWEYRVNTTSATVSWRTRLLGLLNSSYQPIEPELFRDMMNALPIRFERFTFVDIGSGKGRALLLAAEYPFRRIVGVELLPELNRTAEENIRRFETKPGQVSNIEARCEDAVAFQFPPEPLVVFLFNPLPEAGLQTVVSNLESSLRQKPRPVYVIYANPLLERVLEGNPALVKLAGTHQFSVFSFREHGIGESREA